MTTKMPEFEIPKEMRDFAEKGVSEARKAFDGFMGAAYKAAGAVEQSTGDIQDGAREIGRKSLSYAEQNVTAALDFAQRVVNAKTPSEIMAMNAEFLKSQMQNYSEQAKELGTTASKVASTVAKPNVG